LVLDGAAAVHVRTAQQASNRTCELTTKTPCRLTETAEQTDRERERERERESSAR